LPVATKNKTMLFALNLKDNHDNLQKMLPWQHQNFKQVL